jgi:serine/threonine protein kinase
MPASESGQSSHKSSTGKRLGGFEITGKLGHGAMGTVFKARQVSVDRTVALKILPPRLAANEQYVQRFLREARAAAALNHPNIVQAIDAGHVAGYYYFAMEYVDGLNAESLIQQLGRVPERRALEIVRDVALALDHASSRAGIIHRDVKPGNIMLTSEGVAKLADLGLVRHESTDSPNTSLTQAGMPIGTPDYISPEQARGDKDLDARTDIYSLGATLYHLVCGAPPYAGSSATDVMAQHMRDPIPDPRQQNPDLSVGVCSLIRKAMAKNRNARYATARAMVDDVERLLAGRRIMPVVPPNGQSRHRVRHSTARRKSKTGQVVGIGFGVIAAIALAVIILPRLVAKDPSTPPETETVPTHTNSDQRVYDFVTSWVLENPEEYSEGIRRLEQAKESIKDTVLRMKIEDDLAAVRRHWQVAADGAFAMLQTKAEALRKEGNIDAAVTVYADIPKRFQGLLADRGAHAVAKLKANAEEAIRSAMKAAQSLSDDGETAGALAILDKLAQMQYAALSGEVASLRTRIEDAGRSAADIERRRKLAAARKKVDELLGKIETAAASGDFAEAKRLADSAVLSEEEKLVEDRFRAVVAVGKAFTGLSTAAETSPAVVLRQRIGKDETLRTKSGVHRGQLKEVTDNVAVLERVFSIGGQEHRREYRVNLAELTAEDIARLKPTWTPQTPDEHLVAAIIALHARNASETEAALKAAEGHTLQAHYMEKLGELRTAQAELAARQAWDDAIAQLINKTDRTDEEQKHLLAAIETFQRTHGSSRFASDRADDLLRAQKQESRTSTAKQHETQYFTSQFRLDVGYVEPDRSHQFIKTDRTFTLDGVFKRAAIPRQGIPSVKVDGHLTRPDMFPKLMSELRDTAFKGLWLHETEWLTNEHARLISQLPQLELLVIGVWRSEMNSDGLEHLKRLPKLRILNIGTWDMVNDKNLEILGTFPALEELQLRNGNPSSRGIAQLARLPKLEYLGLSGTRIGGRVFESPVAFRSLKRLSIRGDARGGVNKHDLQGIDALPSLERLVIQTQSASPDTWMGHIAGCRKLQVISLQECTGLTNDHLVSLRKIPGLRVVAIKSNQVTDSAIPILMSIPSLRDAHIKNCGLSEGGLKRLADLLKSRRENEARADWDKIRAYVGRYGVDGAAKQALSDALDRYHEKHSKTDFMQSIAGETASLRARLRGERPAPLLSADRFDSTFPLYVWIFQGAGSYKNIGQTPSPAPGGIKIPAGVLWGVTPVDAKGFNDAKLRELVPELKRQRIPGLRLGHVIWDGYKWTPCPVTDDGLKHLIGLSDLSLLSLPASKVSGAGMEHLGKMEQLTHLDLERCEGIGDAAFAHIGELGNLKFLRVRNKRLSPAGLAPLAKLERLESLHIVGTAHAWPTSAVEHIAKLKSLRRLDIMVGHDTPKSIELLAALSNLERLKLHAYGLGTREFQWLHRMPIKSLDLSVPSLNDKHMASISGFKELEAFVFRGESEVTDAGLVHLRDLPKLRFISLPGKATDACLPHLMECQSLVRVIGGKLSDAGRKKLAEFLERNRQRLKQK